MADHCRSLPGERAEGAKTWLEGGLLVLAAPFLLFPAKWPGLTVALLGVLALLWLFRSVVERMAWPITSFNTALLLFGLMIGVGIIVSPLPDQTLPKATGLIWGLAVFRLVALWTTNRRRFTVVLLVFCLAGLGILVIGLLGADWGAKIPALKQLTARLPTLATQLPDAPEAGISPNQLAGALTLYLPLAVLGVFGWRPTGHRVWLWLPMLIALLLLLGVLLLTQSRGGWVGAGAGLSTLIGLAGLTTDRPWARWTAALFLCAVLISTIGGVLLLGGIEEISEALYGPSTESTLEEAVGAISIEGRIEIWSRALYAVADFPFTGCGLGTFREVVWLLYPLFLVPTGIDIAHAHNIFLQTALDLGLPGLVAYLALLSVAGAVSWQAARRGDFLSRRVALGLAAGLVGLHVYGLTDAVALGSKPGLAFWMALGLIAALPSIDAHQEPPSP